MQEVEVTFRRAARVWWAWSWRAMGLAFIFSFAIGFVLGLIGYFTGINHQHIMRVSMISGGLIAVYVSIWMMSKILKKNFGSFRIALIKNASNSSL